MAGGANQNANCAKAELKTFNEILNMKKMLVTGGAGFIGANFCHYWMAKYHQDQLIVLDALTYAGHREHLLTLESEGLVFIQGDIGDQLLVEDIFEKYQIDTLVHFAAESHVDRSISGPDAFIQTNVLGTHTLLKVAKQYWLDKGIVDHRFHHVSTDEVYGSLSDNAPAFNEQT